MMGIDMCDQINMVPKKGPYYAEINMGGTIFLRFAAK
jgi:hypothetical protein